LLDGDRRHDCGALLAEHGRAAAHRQQQHGAGLARLLRRNPTDAERILWQALTRDAVLRDCSSARPGRPSHSRFRLVRARIAIELENLRVRGHRPATAPRDRPG